MTTTSAQPSVGWQDKALSLERGWLLTAAIVSVLIGVFVLARPQSGVLTIAITFGLYLVFGGAARFSFALTDTRRSAGVRWIGAILGVLVVIAGFYCLLNLESSLIVLGVTLGIGLIGVGFTDLVSGNRERVGQPSWLRITSGVLAVLAGIIMLVVPFISVSLIVWTGAIILVAIGIVGIATVPLIRSDDPL
jgi:uncharacterized membrane protein HdeD (DUF308 family)